MKRSTWTQHVTSPWVTQLNPPPSWSRRSNIYSICAFTFIITTPEVKLHTVASFIATSWLNPRWFHANELLCFYLKQCPVCSRLHISYSKHINTHYIRRLIMWRNICEVINVGLMSPYLPHAPTTHSFCRSCKTLTFPVTNKHTRALASIDLSRCALLIHAGCISKG